MQQCADIWLQCFIFELKTVISQTCSFQVMSSYRGLHSIHSTSDSGIHFLQSCTVFMLLCHLVPYTLTIWIQKEPLNQNGIFCVFWCDISSHTRSRTASYHGLGPALFKIGLPQPVNAFDSLNCGFISPSQKTTFFQFWTCLFILNFFCVVEHVSSAYYLVAHPEISASFKELCKYTYCALYRDYKTGICRLRYLISSGKNMGSMLNFLNN